ncbi:MAG TPA: serine/threonine-protein kinase, partial [Polyangia bacterium]|nr:serine/threonine-protein kinase [Polyangia bacterium]
MIKPEVTRGAVERTFGRYQLLEPLTKGGMAEVWRAKLVGAESFERPMVIKRILPHLCDDPAFVRMFITEARLSAKLNHPNIVQVFELGDVDGELFMALELINGADLATLLNSAMQALPLGLCALVAHEICRALSYAQSVTDEFGVPLAIVHRDVSPSNVMIGYDGQVRLLDFGIAKALGAATDHRSRTGSIKGKLSYMAPEVFDGAAFDHR